MSLVLPAVSSYRRGLQFIHTLTWLLLESVPILFEKGKGETRLDGTERRGKCVPDDMSRWYAQHAFGVDRT